ncbi:hypothetical protein [Sporosarcina sp.]|uniref:hypothetical protein n=1 Tax=Sporosarcina sp. TaxID=49982 RepID=UPI002609ECDE|nr:hypothetical protein [Sporosarcina sp.]
MKKQIISTLGALMLTTGVLHGISAEASPSTTTNHQASVSHYQDAQHNQAVKVDVTKLPEYATIASKVNVSSFNFKEDQKVIRKMLLNDVQGRTQYKTIYNKNTKQLNSSIQKAAWCSTKSSKKSLQHRRNQVSQLCNPLSLQLQK